MKAKVASHLKNALSVNRDTRRPSAPAARHEIGKIFVVEGTPEWNAHQDFRRTRGMRPLMARALMDGNAERRGAYVETLVPTGYDEATGEKLHPQSEEAVA